MSHNWLLIVYLAVIGPPFLFLLGAAYVAMWRETRGGSKR